MVLINRKFQTKFTNLQPKVNTEKTKKTEETSYKKPTLKPSGNTETESIKPGEVCYSSMGNIDWGRFFHPDREKPKEHTQPRAATQEEEFNEMLELVAYRVVAELDAKRNGAH